MGTRVPVFRDIGGVLKPLFVDNGLGVLVPGFATSAHPCTCCGYPPATGGDCCGFGTVCRVPDGLSATLSDFNEHNTSFNGSYPLTSDGCGATWAGDIPNIDGPFVGGPTRYLALTLTIISYSATECFVTLVARFDGGGEGGFGTVFNPNIGCGVSGFSGVLEAFGGIEGFGTVG